MNARRRTRDQKTTCTHTYASKHTHKHARTSTQACTQAHAHKDTRPYTHTPVHPPNQSIDLPACAGSSCSHECMHASKRARTHTQLKYSGRPFTNANTTTHACTRAYNEACPPACWCELLNIRIPSFLIGIHLSLRCSAVSIPTHCGQNTKAMSQEL